MEPLYAVGGILAVWLGSLVWAYYAGRASLEDDLRSERARADRAEAIGESRRLALVEAAKRSLRARAAAQAVSEASERIDRLALADDAATRDLGGALDELLLAAGHGAGRPDAEAGATGASAAEGDGGAGEGVGAGGDEGRPASGPAARG